MSTAKYDIVVVGSGPAGQKAAVMAAKAGKRVAVVEREQGLGGGCVYRGTIPSKTLRETALSLDRIKRGAQAFECRLKEGIEVGILMHRLAEVVEAHSRYMTAQLKRNHIAFLHGCCKFVSDHVLELTTVDGLTQALQADVIVLAAGSRPKAPHNVPVDHEHILDSDSILSMIYLPKSLAILGGGVIACEYASIFSLLGVAVTLIDLSDRPLRFMDEEIVQRFLHAFIDHGGRYIGQAHIESVRWDGVTSVVTTLAGGDIIKAEKMLAALGRQPNIDDLDVEMAGLSSNERGFITVDRNGQTSVPHIYVVGDMAGPPSLASAAMEQGRRAVAHALGTPVESADHYIPMGIYTIPEIASVGLDEPKARARFRNVIVGRAAFDEVAKAQIAGTNGGLLKLVAGPDGRQILGVQVVGEHATELVHLAELVLLNGNPVDTFVESIFNFPTYAEAYRIAALDIVKQRSKIEPLAKAS
ncbi:NAD(P)(+) transhydrogenase [Nitrospira sp.]|nr:NAD(P)(+) transhydrogenase [Nitrospira sp.]